MASWGRMNVSLLLLLGASILLSGCAPLECAVRDVVLQANLQLDEYAPCFLSESGRLYIGVSETWSEHDSGRTVLTALDLSGKARGKIALPDGLFAEAIYADGGAVYCLCKRLCEDSDKSWRLLKMTLAGSVVWDREIHKIMFESESETLHLSIDDWRNVQIVSRGKPDELSVIWQAESSRPETGTLEFSRWTGQITGFLEGIQSETGAKYSIWGRELARITGTGPGVTLLTDEDARWAFDYVNGRLVAQASRDRKTGNVRYVEGGLAPVLDTPLPYPVRNNGRFFYAVDPGRKILRLVRIR